MSNKPLHPPGLAVPGVVASCISPRRLRFFFKNSQSAAADASDAPPAAPAIAYVVVCVIVVVPAVPPTFRLGSLMAVAGLVDSLLVDLLVVDLLVVAVAGSVLASGLPLVLVPVPTPPAPASVIATPALYVVVRAGRLDVVLGD
ncbi:uncharacterized protein EV422DRAFT_235465 [Fimicolochytrium jonesii]|uniref:uncharacterized protein n=1 Tax=Fimicolochytrium jonesii TaxID=1396493 RepID=UPI0022FDF0B6|nr:uncharacterized protein EV422DRAFT_235465 [Fimicolochytrium jonesii]KAI8824850.1 hypothetical protein EV422DRAFT_235465 [Fimicolochytrium jonesii]